MLAQSLSNRTIDERIRVIRDVCGNTGLMPDELDPLAISQWLAIKPNPVTRWSYYTCIKAFFRWRVISGRQDSSPLEHMPAPKRPKYYPRPLAPEHVQTVLAGPLRLKTRVAILLAAYEGLRVHEIAKIHGRDYDRTSNQLTVLGKGRQLAIIPIHGALIPFLTQMPVKSWWFPQYAHGGGPVQPNSISATIKRAFARHGIDMKPHQLRHTYGTQLLAAGVDLRIVQELMRHESIQSTALYTQVTNAQLEDAINQLNSPPETENQ